MRKVLKYAEIRRFGLGYLAILHIFACICNSVECTGVHISG